VQRPEFSWKKLGENFVQDNTPACNIAYPDAIAFCEWMSTNSGRTIRLPTEEEWEYACRCGRRGTWSFGDDPEQLDQYAWTRSNSAGEIHTVRGLLPNAWGLFDMHGNEFEWCFEPTAVNGDYSGTGPMRGGSFGSIPELTRSSARHRTRLSESAQGAFRILMERK
jgi:formylglycine-generating enzyme required for sulfatase activity